MNDKKNIDRLFQERFKNMETPAPGDAWKNISNRLDKNDTPVINPFWWKVASVAAVLALIFSAVLWNSDEFLNQEGVVIDKSLPLNEIDQNKSSDTNRDAVVLDHSDDIEAEMESNVDPKATESIPYSPQNESDGKEQSKNPNKVAAGTQNQGRNAITINSDSNKDGFLNSNNDIDNNNVLNESKSNRNTIASNTPADDLIKTTEDLKVNAAALAVLDKTQEIDDASKKTLEEIAAAEKSKILDSKSLQEDIYTKRWSAATVVAPVYANSLGGSSVNTAVINNSKTAEVNLSYGVAVAYNFASGWSVRSGVNQVRMSYNTENINYALNARTFEVNNSSSTVTFDSNAVNVSDDFIYDNSAAQELTSAATFSSLSGELSQQLGYIEVPLEIKYRLMDSKFGISVLGGMSALFLTDNEVSVINDGRKLDLGVDSNFQNFNQSANFGLGIDYRFTDRLGISVEPTFKYQLNTLRNNPADFKPYTIGVYTGLMYRF